MWMSQDKEKEDHRWIRATPSIQMLGISKWQDTQRWRADTGSLGTGSGPVWMGWDPHGPQILPLGPHESRLGHRVPDGWSPNAKSSGFLDPPGFLEASLVPDKSSSPALWFSLILTVSTALRIMLNTLPWFQQAPFFVFPLRCWENTPGTGLEDEGQVWCLLSRDGRQEGDHIATSPAARWFFAWSLYPGIN